jgi:GH24 family phage-related lysozyme (muramidase)
MIFDKKPGSLLNYIQLPLNVITPLGTYLGIGYDKNDKPKYILSDVRVTTFEPKELIFSELSKEYIIRNEKPTLSTLDSNISNLNKSNINYKKENNKSRLSTLTTKSGKTYQAATLYAKNFEGFLTELENTGYTINDIVGYDQLSKSFQSSGVALIINPDNNASYTGPVDFSKTDLPNNIATIARRHGFGWGGESKGTRKEPMYFSLAGSDGGTEVGITPGVVPGSSVAINSNSSKIGYNYTITTTEKKYGYITVGSKRISLDTGNITRTQAEILLEKQLRNIGNVIQDNVFVPLGQPQFDALLVMFFYEGVDEIKGHTIIKMINQERWYEITDEIQKNIKRENGRVDERLAVRKMAISKMWSYVPGYS